MKSNSYQRPSVPEGQSSVAQRVQRWGLIEYIGNQKRHHEKRDYEEEFVELLRSHGVSYDRAFVFG